MAVDILVADVKHEDLLKTAIFFLENSQIVSVFFGIVYFLDSAEDPIIILVFNIVLFDEITALNEILYIVQVSYFGLVEFAFDLGELLFDVLDQEVLDV